MKNKLPLILFGVGVFIFALVLVFVMRNRNNNNNNDAEEKLIEVAFVDRPYVSLTPRSDGHWLDLQIQKFNQIAKAASLDYELLYTLPDGRVQGVPGTVKLEGLSELKRELLLGSESSGKFRYDEGVEEGTLTIRFRDSKGKLMAKFTTKFSMKSASAKQALSELNSVDQNFKYTFAKPVKSDFYLVMETFGLPATSSVGQVASGPYGVFTSMEKLPEGTAEGWQNIEGRIFYK